MLMRSVKNTQDAYIESGSLTHSLTVQTPLANW